MELLLIMSFEGLTGTLHMHDNVNSFHAILFDWREQNINLTFNIMESLCQCNHCSCKLIRKLAQTDDLFAFIKEYAPTEVVLENMCEASKSHLLCTCCIYARILKMLADRHS